MTRLGIRPATMRGIVVLALIALVTILATRDIRQDLQTTRTNVDTAKLTLFPPFGRRIDWTNEYRH